MKNRYRRIASFANLYESDQGKNIGMDSKCVGGKWKE